MHFVDKKRRVLQRKPTESLYLRLSNEKKKEPASNPAKEVFRASLRLALMYSVDKERRGLQRKPTKSLYPHLSNEKKKEPHEVAEEKLPISTSRTLRTSKLNGFINAANSLRSNSAAKYYEPIFTKRS